MNSPHSTTSRKAKTRHTKRSGWLAKLAIIGVAAFAVLIFSPGTADAKDKCTDKQWHSNWSSCVDDLKDEPEATCKAPPVPGSPDSGLAGSFAKKPGSQPAGYKNAPRAAGKYSGYGYSGYTLPEYDLGCAGDTVPSEDSAGNSLANLEFTLATGVIGSANGLRQAAWEPSGMWGWADKLVENASHAIFTKVFSVFGAVTVGLVGLYLIWRSRQADMSMAITTAGWAILVLVVVTAVARWPVESANFADDGMTSSLGVVQDAVGPPSEEGCIAANNMSEDERKRHWDNKDCLDVRSPAGRASDMATDEILYNNWIRSVLGQSEERGNTAYKYGPALYDATAFSWTEIKDARQSASDRQSMVKQKQNQWRKVAAAIEKEDPEAYENLTGAKGWDRVGTGFMALLSALFFALFDITASVLIILGFLLIRWAVIALPLIGTVAILRPASGGFKRLVSAVLAAIINVVVFGVAAAVYLYAASQVLSANLAGWLQVLLIALMGVAAWMLLRPYRRIGSLTGGRSVADSFMGRRKTVHRTVTTTKDGVTTSHGETDHPDQPPGAAGDGYGAKNSRVAAKREHQRQQEPSGSSPSLPPRPAPGGSGTSRRQRPGYSVYRPSSTGSTSTSAERPMVAVRPD